MCECKWIDGDCDCIGAGKFAVWFETDSHNGNWMDAWIWMKHEHALHETDMEIYSNGDNGEWIQIARVHLLFLGDLILFKIPILKPKIMTFQCIKKHNSIDQ